MRRGSRHDRWPLGTEVAKRPTVQHGIQSGPGCNGRAVALTIPLGRELARAVQGVPDNELALPFTEPVQYVAHGLLRKLAPWMLVLYRRREAQEPVRGDRFELLRWAEQVLASHRSR